MTSDDDVRWFELSHRIEHEFEIRSIEKTKLAVEFSKIIVSNLIIINGGALLAIPVIYGYLKSEKYDVSLPSAVTSASLFVIG